MAGMKRFVTYIYAYEDKKKGNNIGFAKIEIRGEDCRMEIHLRGVYARQSLCRVYLFRETEGTIEGVFIGDLRLVNGNGDFGGTVKAGHIGESPFGIGDMEGIFLLTEDERIFMSRWKEGKPLAVCKEAFHVWQAKQPTETTEPIKEEKPAAERGKQEQPTAAEPIRQRQRMAETETGEQEELPRQSAETEPIKQEHQKTAEEQAKQPTAAEAIKQAQPVRENTTSEQPDGASEQPVQDMQATEIPMRNVFPDYGWESTWERLIQEHRLYHPFEDPAAECIQIELKNLRELPKCYWYLGNNSFLLHGFFNYHYLVVGRTGEARWFIGVPGIYQRQERVMAAIFGFSEFLAVKDKEKDGECKEPVNRFGCWCRYIEE